VGEKGNVITEVCVADREKLPRSGAANCGVERLKLPTTQSSESGYVLFLLVRLGDGMELRESISKH
jgi:hypothetical protein